MKIKNLILAVLIISLSACNTRAVAAEASRGKMKEIVVDP